MNGIIGIIKFVIGQVFVIALDGSQRLLVAGERIYSGEEVVTGDNGAVSIALPDGRTLDLGRDSRWSDVAGVASQKTADVDDEVAALQSAIAQGEDPTQVLEPTAAGNDVVGEAGDGGGGHTAVVLDLTGEIVDISTATGYETTGLASSTDSPIEGGDASTTVLAASDTNNPDSSIPPSLTLAFNNDGTVSFSFTSPPVGFDESDITVDNGTLTSLIQDPNAPMLWTAVLTPASRFEGEVRVSVPDGSYTDESGTSGTGVSGTITVDTLAPDASITIDTVTGDDVINIAESGQNVNVSGKVGNNVQAGDVVMVTVGSETYQTTVNANGVSWSVSVPGSVLAANTEINANVTTRDEAGNETTANTSRTYDADTVAPHASITINTIAGDDSVNIAESNQTVNVTGRVGNNVQAGDTVTVTVGSETYQTTVNADGISWSVSVPGSVLAANTEINASVTTADAAGNSTTASADRSYTVDTVAPEASITIDTVAGDDVVNIDESNQAINVTGKVGNNVQAGDAVTVTVGAETFQTTVNADGVSWSVDVPGSVLAGNTEINASVTTADAAGNSTTVSADRSYTVDTVAPDASITIDTIAGDDRVNIAESSQSVNISGKVSNNVQAGDTVTVAVGSETYQTTVNADGISWSVDIPGSVLASNSAVSASVTTADAAGNTTTAEASRPYAVDTVAPDALISIDTIAGDDRVNIAESSQSVNISGKVGNNVQAGDAVTVTVGNETYQTTVNADGTSWSVNVPGSVLAGNTEINASVTTADAAGNSTTVSADRPYTVDTIAPEASITIDTVAGDDRVNIAESNQAINVTGKVGNNVQAGDAVTVTVGNETYQTTVNADGVSWSVSVPGSVLTANTNVTASVTTTDAAGNTTTAEANRPYTVDTVAPEASITIDTIAGDDVVNIAESSQAINVTGKVGNNVQADDAVTVTVGNETYQTTVNADGTSWSVNVPGSVLAGNTEINASVTTADSAGNTTTISADRSYTVDTLSPEASITIDTIAGDDMVNIAESGQTINVTGRVGNNVQAGDVVTVTVGSETYQTTVNADGISWSVNIPGSVLAANTNVTASVTTADAAGNTTTAEASRPYAVDTVAPDASITIDTIAGDDRVNIAESSQSVNISGKVSNNVQAGDTVTVTVGSETYQTTVNADGISWSVSVPGSVLAANTEINASVTTADAAGNSTTASADRSYTVDTIAPDASITIDTVAGDDMVNIDESNQTINVTGRVGNNVQAGDAVTVTVGSETYQTTVDADGISWSVNIPDSVLAANTNVSASVTTADAAGNTTTASANRSYTVDTVAPDASITIDTVAGDDVVNIAESGQTINVTGRVGNNVQAGDTVTVTVGAETYQTTVNADGVSWSIDIPGSVLASNLAVSASVTTTDSAGNTTTVSADRPYTVDTIAPEASITIDTVAGDDRVNIDESNQTVNVTGRVGNNVQAGDAVTVTVGSETYQTTVNADGVSWSVDIPGSVLAANTEINASVTTTDAAGNTTTASAERTYTVDTIAPDASITIDTVAGDDVVNIAESNQTINVTGRVGNNVQAGDTVTVTVGAETFQTTVNADGISWSIDIPGSVLTANTNVSASVTTADAAGNTTTASANRSYTVDTVAPDASITIDTVAGDDVVNIAESSQAINVTGKVGNNVQAGDAVTVTVGAKTYQTTVNADGVSWSVDIPGSVLASNLAVSASVTTTDAAGNTTTASADRSYAVDTVAPDASITIDTVAGDDRVNIAESNQAINVTGKVGNNVQAGDTVTVAVGSETYQTTVNADGVSWSIDIPGSVLASNLAVSASVTTTDAAGNTTTASADRSYAVDTVAPEASITIDTVAGDDMVNIAESGQTVNVTGSVGNNVQAGDTVTVTVGNETYQTTVNADGTSWSVNVPGSVLAGNTEINASVTTADAAGNSTTVSADRPYTVDTIAPEASITIDTVAGDDRVNIAESNQAINVTGKVGNNVQAGDAVTVTVGNETYQTTVNADGVSWSVSVPGSVLTANTNVSASVTTADAAGNTTTASADRPYTVDTIGPEASITIDTVAGDDRVNIAESNQAINVTGKVGNNVQAGDAVTVTVGAETYQTTVNADGVSWSRDIPGSVLASNSAVSASVTTTDAAGNSTTASADRSYTVDTVAPDASITIDTVAGDDRVNIAESNQAINVTGKVGNNVQAGDAVTVTVGAETYQTTVNADGVSWSRDIPGSVLASNSAVSASVTTTDAAGNSTTASADRSYTVDTVAPDASITIDTVAGDDRVNIAESSQSVNISGKVGNNVQTGDTVTVAVGSETYQTTVNADGVSWSIDIPGSVLASNSAVSASVTTTDAAGNTTTVSAERTYTVDTIAPDASITIDTVAGDDRVNIAESNQTVNVTGRVGNNVQAGDTVTVTVGSEAYQTTVNADGISWSVSVPGSVLAANTNVSASVTTADAAGNTTIVESNRPYTVDTVAPDASITIDTVAGDDVVNIAESNQAINVSGRVGNNVQAGDAVTVTVGAETFQTTVNVDGVSWSISVPGSVLASNSAVSASVTTTDAAGNTTTASADRSYTVDTIAPDALISIDTIAGDDRVNIAESSQSVNISGKVGNNVQAGDAVTVTVGNETYQTTVNADGTSWSVNVPGSVLAGNTEINASVTTADAAGNTTTAEASRPYTVDTIAPDASITIDTVAGDDMVNIDESNQTINVTGRVGNNVQAGDAVTVTVGSETYQTTVNADGVSWSVSVPGSVLAANTNVTAGVTTADAAGNTTIAEANRPYTVDTVAPDASITIDTVAGDDVVNIAESNQAINVTGKVGNNVQAGDTVTVTVGAETFQTTVNADGISWSIDIPGSVLTANTNVSASVTTADAAGNTTTASANRSYTVDTVAPDASITIDTVAGDDVVNIAESSQAINVTGKVGNNVQAGDAVTVTVGAETYQTTVNADGVSWSIDIPGSVLASNLAVSASVTTTDAAGNTTTASADRSYAVDTVAPEASITIDTVAGDDMVNIAESGQTVNVTGSVGNNVQAGDTVTVTVGNETYQTTVNADGTSWSVNVPGSVLTGNTEINASVTTADAAGNTTTASADRPYTVDTVAPDASITIDTVAGDDRVNIAESGQAINVTGKVGNNVQAGDVVTVTVGSETFQTTVNADGISWSVNIPGSVLAANTNVTASVTTADAAGNTTTAEASRPYAVDTVAPDASITIDTIAGDDRVNIAESSQSVNISGKVSNNVQAGDAVTVTVGAETYQTTVNADGISWSVSVPGSVLAANTEINASVTTADAAGNTTTAEASRPYAVDTVAPDASITIDTVAGDDVVNIAESNQTINVAGRVGNNVQAGDAVTVTVGAETYQTTVNADGVSWSVDVPGSVLAGNTEINASVTTADAAGNSTTVSADRSYTVDTIAPDASITIDTIAGDDRVNIAESSQSVNISGQVGNNVQAGDTVTVTVGSETYQTTVNADDISWSVSVPGNVLAGNTEINASVTTADAAGNTTTASANRSYTVDTVAPDASITIDTVAGDDVVNIAESSQAINVTGKVGNNVQAGDAVTVTVGAETYQTTVNADGVSWSIDIPGSVLASNLAVSASVTTADAAGNTTTAEANRPYTVDTIAPEASITIDTIAGDDMVNIAESGQTVNVTGSVGNNVQAGDTVTVTVGNETYQTTVNADGTSWSVNVPGSVLAGNTEINASVTTADAAGNTTTAEASRPYAVDTVAPDASITIDTVAGDDMVNIDESNQTINVTGKVGNNVQAGDAVTVTVGSETYQTTVNADGISWSVSVPGNVLAGNTEINASVTTADAAGNTTTAEANRPYAVDTIAPDASITIDTVAGDDVVNIAESGQTINVTGRVGNNVQAGDAVTVTVGAETFQTTVNADGVSWSVSVPGNVLAGNTEINASVTTADAAGNTTTAEASRPYAVDTVAPDASITIDTVAGDDVVNIAESSQAINVTGKVGNNVQAGDAVTVTVGSETYQTTVNADGISWSIDIPGSVLASNLAVSASVTTADAAGNTTTAEASRPYTVDTIAPEASITIDTIAGDDVVNIAESNQAINVTGKVGNNVQAGDTVTVTVGSETYQTTVNADGITWSVIVLGSILASNTQVNASIAITDTAGNTNVAEAIRPYTIDTVAPEIDITHFAGNDGYISQYELINTPISGTSSEKTVDLVFTDVNGKSVTLSNVPVVDGRWQTQTDLSSLAEGKITVDATATDQAGNQSVDSSNAVMDATPPIAHNNSVTGSEDSPLHIGWSDLGVSADTASIVISALPTANVGILYFNDGGDWKAVTIGQEFTAQNLDLRFEPVENAAGLPFSEFLYQPVDAVGNIGSNASVSIDITPVADAPIVTLNITSGETTPAASEIIAVNGGSENGGFDIQDGQIIAIGDGVRVWLTEGDPLPTVVGSGTVAYYSQGNTSGDGNYADIFVVHSGSGYFYRQSDWSEDQKQLKLLDSFNGNRTSNGSGAHQDYVFVMKEDGYTYSASNSTNNNQDSSVNTLDGLKVNYTDSEGNSGSFTTQVSNNIEGVIYSDGTTYTPGSNSATIEKVSGQAGTQEHTIEVSASLVDLDGSETLSGITLTGIPEGTILNDHINNVTYTVGSDGSYLIPNTQGASTLAGTITISVPVDVGEFSVVAQATSTESANYDSATGSSMEGVEQYGLSIGSTGNDDMPGTNSHDLMVADVSGLQLVEGQNYNIAFMVDSSGSMSSSDIAKTQASLTDVFNSLVKSASGTNAGTVNVFLADFDTQVGKTVSVNLSDPNALQSLTDVLNSMVGGSASGGGTNYEDVFKTTANWFQSDTVTSNVGNNLTYFITDGEPTFYQIIESNEVRVSDRWQSLNIDNITYTPGQSYYMDVRGAMREVIDAQGNVYQYHGGLWNSVTKTVIGQVHAQGDGTYEISSLGGAGNNNSYWNGWRWVDNSGNLDTSNTHAAEAFSQLKALSNVEAIGIGNDLNASSLQHYDTDGYVQDHIDPSQLNEAILGSNEPMKAGDDYLDGGLGNDILFGDVVAFDNIEGNGLSALQSYIAEKMGVQDGTSVTAKDMHGYITSHSSEFDLPSANDGNDILNGGAGNDILFGQGGRDILNGGSGNDLLYGGSGDDLLIGGAGNDVLIGGAGADTFTWQAGEVGHDIIKDFNANEGDRIDLSDLIGELEEGTDISRYLRITENQGSPVIEVSTEGNFTGDKGGTVAVSITLEHYSGDLPSLESLISKPDQVIN